MTKFIKRVAGVLFSVCLVMGLLMGNGKMEVSAAGTPVELCVTYVNDAGETVIAQDSEGNEVKCVVSSDDLHQNMGATDTRYWDIQCIFDWIKDNSNGRIMTVKFPAGTYSVGTSAIDLYGNTVLDLSDPAGVTLTRAVNGHDANSILRIGCGQTSKPRAFSGYELKNISILGGTINGGGGNSSMLRFAHAENVTISKVHFTGVYQAHHMAFAASQNVTITECQFDGYEQEKSYTTNVEAIQLDILNETHFSSASNYDATVINNVNITNNTFGKGLSRGVGAHSAEIGKYFSNINISNNTFTGTIGYAINATHFINSTIDGNTITDCGSGIMVKHMIQNYKNYYEGVGSTTPNTATNMVISNNNISVSKSSNDDKQYGIYLYGEELASAVTIQDKDEDSGKDVTIKIPKGDYRLSGIKVTGNTITTTVPGNMLWLKGTFDSEIRDNKVIYDVAGSSDESDGIKIEGSTNIAVSGNTIKDNNGKTVGNGIYVKVSSTKIELTGNTITNAKENGIHISENSSATKVDGNTITNVGKYGVYMNKTAANSVSSNSVEKCARGIFVNGSTAEVTTMDGNSLIDCKDYGIFANNKATIKKVTNNTVKGPKYVGIYSANNSKISTITGNTVKNAKKNGIAVYSTKTKVTVSDNDVSGAKQYGIVFMKGVKGTISNNTVKKCSKAEICVQDKPNTYLNASSVKASKPKAAKGGVELKWSDAKGAVKYIVYRSTDPDSGFKKIGTATGTSYTDKKAKKGKTYYYKVAAYTSHKSVTVTGNAVAFKSVKAK